MGAVASMNGDTPVDLEKAKELAGVAWTEELEGKYNGIFTEKGVVTLDDLKSLAPSMFENGDELITIERAKELAAKVGVEWQDELDGLFVSNAEQGEVLTISLTKWKSLVPTMFESPEERATRLESEFQAVLAARADGNVVINYQMYNEEFPIAGNTLTADRINEDYGLRDVMPGCWIRLSAIDPKGRTLFANAHSGQEAPYVREDPVGTFKDLLAGETYYCIVIENPEQYQRDMAELQKRLAADGIPKEEPKSRAQEGCSCLFGNPCMDQYICKDWDNRMAVAKRNGWKGF